MLPFKMDQIQTILNTLKCSWTKANPEKMWNTSHQLQQCWHWKPDSTNRDEASQHTQTPWGSHRQSRKPPTWQKYPAVDKHNEKDSWVLQLIIVYWIGQIHLRKISSGIQVPTSCADQQFQNIPDWAHSNGIWRLYHRQKYPLSGLTPSKCFVNQTIFWT